MMLTIATCMLLANVLFIPPQGWSILEVYSGSAPPVVLKLGKMNGDQKELPQGCHIMLQMQVTPQRQAPAKQPEPQEGTP